MADLGWRVNRIKLDIIASTKFVFYIWLERGGVCSTAALPRPLLFGAPMHFSVYYKMTTTTQTFGKYAK